MRDNGSIPYRQSFQTRSVVLQHCTECAIDTEPADDVKNYVLGANPRCELPVQPHAPHLGHDEPKGLTGKRQTDFDAADPDGEHADSAYGVGMAVGARQRGSGQPEALHVNRVAYAVSGPAQPHAVLACGAGEHRMILVVPVGFLEQEVVYVRHGQVGSDTCYTHGFEFQSDHRAHRIVEKDLVDRERDVRADFGPALYQVRLNESVGQVLHETVTASPAR